MNSGLTFKFAQLCFALRCFHRFQSETHTQSSYYYKFKYYDVLAFRYPVTRPLVAALVTGLRLTPLAVLQLRKVFLRQVALPQVDAPVDDSQVLL